MGSAFMVAFSGALVVGAALFARREIGLYRSADTDGDLFSYSKSRLIRRLVGVGVLAAVGVTLAIWELAPPATAAGGSSLVALLLVEIFALVTVAILDLRETSRTANPGGLPRDD